jgi:hypothetical protein
MGLPFFPIWAVKCHLDLDSGENLWTPPEYQARLLDRFLELRRDISTAPPVKIEGARLPANEVATYAGECTGIDIRTCFADFEPLAFG